MLIVLNLWQCKFMLKSSRKKGVDEADLLEMSKEDDSV